MKRINTRNKVKQETGYSRLITNYYNLIGKVKIVFSGHPDGKNNYEYDKYKTLFKGY